MALQQAMMFLVLAASSALATAAVIFSPPGAFMEDDSCRPSITGSKCALSALQMDRKASHHLVQEQEHHAQDLAAGALQVQRRWAQLPKQEDESASNTTADVAARPTTRVMPTSPTSLMSLTSMASQQAPQPPCICVLSFDRWKSLARLLDQLNTLDYGPDQGNVRLTISIDRPDANTKSERVDAWHRTLEIARNFTFLHGPKVVFERPEHVGLTRQWVDSWIPEMDSNDTRQACAILEDDVFPSKFAWLWTHGALTAYNASMHRIASLAWQRQYLVPAYQSSRGLGPMPPKTHGNPFLYKLLATWGFVAVRQNWIGFRTWFKRRYSAGHDHDIMYEGRAIKPSDWHRNDPSGVWEYWFIRFMHEQNLFTLYFNIDEKKTLCANMQEPGLHFGVGGTQDFPVINSNVSSIHVFPSIETLDWYDWDAKPLTEQSRNLYAIGTNRSSVTRSFRVAISTITNEFGKDLRRLLKSIVAFELGMPVYLGCTSEVVPQIKASFPSLNLVMKPILDKYKGFNRGSLTATGNWTSFQMQKSTIMRIVLGDGYDSVWYLDTDMFLLAPLPYVGGVQVGLSRHQISQDIEHVYGRYNAGMIFSRSTEALRAWEQAAPHARTPDSQDQTALEAMTRAFDYTELGCGVDVGWYQLVASNNVEHKDVWSELHCSEGHVKFKGCTVSSMHVHVGDPRLPQRFYTLLDEALAECGNPMAP